ncbi:MAG: MerR family transcriptional regulator [Clostridiaceae bacterium]|nr:MerR family transcriptional regulator [Clostridiaceae bacterium]
MNNVKTCRRCRKLFNYIASPYCPRCVDEIDREFRIVRDYIYEHPNEGIQEIADATEVDERSILALLRDGRLELDSSSSELQCERCGTSISTGRYCDSCQGNLSSELKRAQKSIGYSPSADSKPTLDRSNKNKKKDDKEFNERMHSRNP